MKILQPTDGLKETVRTHKLGVPETLSLGFNDAVRFRANRGELTILFAPPGSGKTIFLDDVMLNIARQKLNGHAQKWGVFSPESAPLTTHLARLASKVTGKPFYGDSAMSADELTATIEKINPFFCFIDPDSSVNIDQLLETFQEMHDKHGCTAFAIDPFSRIAMEGVNVTEEEKNIMNKLVHFTRKNNVIMWLVCHPRKVDSNGQEKRMGLYDINGSAAFANLAQNIVTLHREKDPVKNPQKETEVWLLKVKLERIVGVLGKYSLYFNPASESLQSQPFERRF